MTTAVAIREEQEVDQALAWLTHLQQSQVECPPSITEIEDALHSLTQPANPVWVMARIAALLLPYYEKDTPQAVREMEAEDWASELDGLPMWAIQKAVRWWKSADNQNRKKRPVEGDIRDRVDIEMSAVRAMQYRLDRGMSWSAPKPDAQRERVTADQTQRIFDEIGFNPRRFA